MKLTVKRTNYSPTATIGELYIDGVRECFTLEDVVRSPGQKIYGQTAIPAGVYTLAITESARFKRLLPLIQNVPNFDGIRIHPGNTSADTDGCLLVGTTKQLPDFIGNSRVAFEALFAKLVACKEVITIEIVNTEQ